MTLSNREWIMTLDTVFTLIGKIPTTQGNCIVAWAATMATTIRYVFSHDNFLPNGQVTTHWVPDPYWLAFLLAYAGVSTAHFLAKRITDTGYIAAKQNGHDK